MEFRPAELAADGLDLEAARATSLRALTRLTRDEGADAPPGPVNLASWAFAHGAASLVAQGGAVRYGSGLPHRHLHTAVGAVS
ncbi:hypothetical protein [Quadrisphaera sp. INWT6]|uniref:hypothetical protein n=1 Tax=Quadrisphaera sp. INWT6 TaxID=2596917 RepID=UPI001891F762|nr:hypothetical protein [Quadrisphaera sp. INWT6]